MVLRVNELDWHGQHLSNWYLPKVGAGPHQWGQVVGWEEVLAGEDLNQGRERVPRAGGLLTFTSDCCSLQQYFFM